MDDLSSPPSSGANNAPPPPVSTSRKRQLESPTENDGGSMFGYFSRMFKTPRKSKDADVSSSVYTTKESEEVTGGQEYHPSTPAPSMILKKIDLKTPTEEDMTNSSLPFSLEDVANGHAKSPLVNTPSGTGITETTLPSSMGVSQSLQSVTLNDTNGQGERRKSAYLKSNQKKRITFANNTMTANTTTASQFVNSPYPNRKVSNEQPNRGESTSSHTAINGVTNTTATTSQNSSISFATNTVIGKTTANKYANSPHPNRGSSSRPRRVEFRKSSFGNGGTTRASNSAIVEQSGQHTMDNQSTTQPKSTSPFLSLNQNSLFSIGRSKRRFRPASRILTAPTTSRSMYSSSSKSRKEAERKRAQERNFAMAQQISQGLQSMSNPDNALFAVSAGTQRIKFGRVLGNNQTGGNRLVHGLDMVGKTNAEVIRGRREDAKSSAFADNLADPIEKAKRGLFSNSIDTVSRLPSNNTSVSVQQPTNGRSENTSFTSESNNVLPTSGNSNTDIPEIDSPQEDVSRVTKRKKLVRFESSSDSKQENTISNNATSDTSKSIQPYRSTPYKAKPTPKKWTGEHQEGRDPMNGSVIFQEETFFDRKLNLHSRLGPSCKAEEESNLTAEVTKNMSYRRIDFSGVEDKKEPTSSTNTNTAASTLTPIESSKSSLPFNFIKQTPDSSRKGKSSILNKDLSNKALTSDGLMSNNAKPKITSSWGNTFAHLSKPGDWTCEGCYLRNISKDLDHCPACMTKRGSTGAPLAKAGSTEAPKTNKDGANGNSPLAVSNAAPLSGESFKKSSIGKGGFKFDVAGKVGGTDGGSSFTFGNNATSVATTDKKEGSSTGFVFGAVNTTASKNDSGSQGFTFGSTSNSSTDKKEEVSSKGFTFGNSTSTSISTPTTTFGVSNEKSNEGSSQTSSKKKRSIHESDETKQINPPAVSIGSSTSEKKEQSNPSFPFGSANGNGVSDKSVSSLNPTVQPFVSSSQAPAPVSGFSFGSSAPTPAPPSEETSTKAAVSSFNFGRSTTPTPIKSEQTSQAPSTAPAFVFGQVSASKPAAAPVASTEKSQPPPPAATFTFGSSTTSAPPKEPSKDVTSTPAFQFGSSDTSAPTELPKESSTAPPPAPASAFQFGSSSTSTPAPPPASSFPIKSESSTQIPPATNFSFGAAPKADTSSSDEATKTSNTTSSFTFGSGSTEPATNTNGSFTFGKATPSSATGFGATIPAPSAGFGSTNASAPAPSTSFGSSNLTTPAPSVGFGSTNATASASSNGFGPTAPAPTTNIGFGASAGTTITTGFGAANATPSSGFGTGNPPTSTPGFGSATTGFGSANTITSAPTSSTGFTFGNTSQTAAPAPSGAMFGSSSTSGTFGDSAPAPSQSGFGANTTTPATANTGFGASMPTGGFSMGKAPTAPANGKRRIVKARRRPGGR